MKTRTRKEFASLALALSRVWLAEKRRLTTGGPHRFWLERYFHAALGGQP